MDAELIAALGKLVLSTGMAIVGYFTATKERRAELRAQVRKDFEHADTIMEKFVERADDRIAAGLAEAAKKPSRVDVEEVKLPPRDDEDTQS